MMMNRIEGETHNKKLWSAWQKVKAEKRPRFNATSGKFESVPCPLSEREIRAAWLAQFSEGKEEIRVPAAMLKSGKLNLEAVNLADISRQESVFQEGVGNVLTPAEFVISETLREAGDPVFRVPDGVAVYAARLALKGTQREAEGRYWLLQKDVLFMATDADGKPVSWWNDSEGFKAKEARLAREEAARKAEEERLAREEAERLEQERQKAQLAELAALPESKFQKLMAMLSGK